VCGPGFVGGFFPAPTPIGYRAGCRTIQQNSNAVLDLQSTMGAGLSSRRGAGRTNRPGGHDGSLEIGSTRGGQTQHKPTQEFLNEWVAQIRSTPYVGFSPSVGPLFSFESSQRFQE
jgi:hypothetical protein